MSLSTTSIFLALILLLVTNGAPVLVNNLLGSRYVLPVDGRFKLPDGRPLFGDTKTWRGLFAAIAMAAVVAVLMGLEAWVGVLFGGLAMTGDLLSSFIKRRLGRDESSHALGLDTVPESLLPTWALKDLLALSLIDIVLIVVLFFLVEEWLSPLLYKLHIRNRPY